MSFKNLILGGPSTGNRLRLMRDLRKMNDGLNLPLTKIDRLIKAMDNIALTLYAIGFIGIALSAYHAPGFEKDKTLLIFFGIFLLASVIILITLPISSLQNRKF